MKTAKLLALTAAFAGMASLPLAAQTANASLQQNATTSAAGMHVNQSADARADASVNHGRADANGAAASSVAAQDRRGSAHAKAGGWGAGHMQMRPVIGELQGKLDSKSAKEGEAVVLKTTEKTKTADGFVIPRGSRLIGHVTEVQAHARGHEQSRMGIAFDRVELKNGQSLAIHSVIESVGPSAAQLEAESMANEDAFGPPARGVAAPGASGGLVNGGVGMVGGATSAIGGAGSAVGSTAGGDAIGAAGIATGDTAANLGRGVGTSAAAVGSLGTHATAFPGVMLDSNAAAGASGTFTAARRNIHFDGGTRMVLGVAAAR